MCWFLRSFWSLVYISDSIPKLIKCILVAKNLRWRVGVAKKGFIQPAPNYFGKEGLVVVVLLIKHLHSNQGKVEHEHYSQWHWTGGCYGMLSHIRYIYQEHKYFFSLWKSYSTFLICVLKIEIPAVSFFFVCKIQDNL